MERRRRLYNRTVARAGRGKGKAAGRKEGVNAVVVSDLRVNRGALEAVCRRYRVKRLEVMGSFARGDAGPESDIDILVTFKPDARVGLEFVELKEELEALFGRPVDLLSRASVERSPNKYFRHFALERTELLYECA